MPPVVFKLALALLGLIALFAAWKLAVRRRVRPPRNEVPEGWIVELVRRLLEASRQSSVSVLSVLTQGLLELEPAADCMLIFAPAGEELHCVYAAGARAEYCRRLRLRRDDPARLVPKAAAAGCRAAFPADGEVLLPTDRRALAVPMLDAGRLQAVTYVSSPLLRGALAADALVRAIECAAAPYAIALERENDRADATRDGLTGLLTPRAFRRLLHEELARTAPLPDRIVSLWFVDTDRFKNINDGFGHPTGDAVLVAMAVLLQAHLVPELDVGGRNGGDEFCALIRGSTKSVALERARAFCAAVRSHDFGVPLRVTASIGVASFPHDAPTSNALLEAADAAMYHSKQSGRDRVSFVLENGAFATLAPEAARPASRSPMRWDSDLDESRAERCLQRSSCS